MGLVHSQDEVTRKLIHMLVGLGAFVVVVVGPALSSLGMFALVLFNLYIWPRIGGRRFWRARDERRGFALGIVLYPLVVLLLILVFWRRLEIVAGVWGLFAFGDGMAGVVGKTLGGARLPWNPRKSWSGALACWLFGALGCGAALAWTLAYQGHPVALGFIASISLAAGLVAAWIESQPQKIDDNISLPLVSALFLVSALETQDYWATLALGDLAKAAGLGALINLVAAGLAISVRAVSGSGAVAGMLLGTLIFTFLGAGGLLLLAAFVALGTGATRFGYSKKNRQELAQGDGGRRGARNAIANVMVAVVASAFAVLTPHELLYTAAFCGALAAATADTLSSEIGQLWGQSTRLITTWKPVAPGTDGGVTVVGSLAGLAGAAIIAVLGWSAGFYSPTILVGVTLAGVLGMLSDSLIGALLERRGLLDNEAVNFLCTLVGALVAAGLGA